MFGQHRVTRVPNRCKSRMYWLSCGCSMGPSNDRIPSNDLQLAMTLAAISQLWQPGKTRTEIERLAVEDYAERAP
jgi:hypothetical protein